MSIEKNTKNTLQHEEGGFTTLINETIQNIKHTGALGVYCYLASKSAGWEICKTHLQNHFDCGKAHINTCFAYLKKIGAIEVKMIRNIKGQCTGWETVLKRKIPQPVQNTENQHSGDLSRIPISQNLGFPESGKSAIRNKRGFTKKEVIKKTKKESVSVFSDSCSIKAHIQLVLTKRKASVSDDIIDQIVFYVGNERDYDSVVKKINIALKLVREGKWQIPQGYKDITSQAIKAKEEQQQREKEIQQIEDAKRIREIKTNLEERKKISPMKLIYGKEMDYDNANQGRMQANTQ